MLADRAPRGTLTKGTVSPVREVPASIERPEYVGRTGPERVTAGEVKSPETILRIRRAARIAAQALELTAEAVRPGVTTEEIDRIGHEFLISQGAYPSSLHYQGFPKSLCTSINETICHGIPDSTVLTEGDIVNIDITAYIGGVHGDASVMALVGEVDEESRLLVERTKEAMLRGVRAARPGRQVNVIGRVIESYARRYEYGVVRDYTGHGVGEAFHSGLIIPHYDSAPHFDDEIVPGMVFTVEPMLTLGDPDGEQWDDGWTVVTKDRSRSAQWEHTILITSDGPEILTVV
ncbi:type I methionyl aminopeptidase [Georgenia sp. Z1491]|uniref:type I methionyl aminopeptidase n=1 Tax=Georgenia sp. Z1491 TaxID=3416707 RepID=UPI003CFAADEA